MKHTCSAAVVHCIDFRLETTFERFLEKEHISDDADIISFAGASKNINENKNGPVINQIKLSRKLHEIKTLYLINHTDCGGYGGRAAFDDDLGKERAHHTSELKKAKERVSEVLPEIVVKTFLANINEDETITFEEIE